ncbi:MAG: tetratricopeptide repeat protein [Acidobacteriia bacterium]|nr:tetratricopeptide repeat protein [Terriglobia bacterium]
MSPRIGVRVIAVVAAGGLFLLPGFGQGRGGVTPPAGGGSSGSTGTPPGTVGPGIGTTTPTIPTNPTPSTNPQPTTLPQPIYITGRVLTEDGNPPTETVTIERVCGGSPHAEGYTDSKGYFGIQLGQPNSGVMQDASETGGYGRGYGGPNTGMPGSRSSLGGSGTGGGNSDMRFMNCDLQAKLGGYRSQLVSLANRRAMDNPDIGTILLHRLTPTEGTTVSAVSLAAPKDAHKAFEKGQEAVKKRKWEEAAKDFQKAVDLYPDYAAAWYELGRLQAAGGAPDTARISFECSMKADPKYTAPYVELATLEVKAKKWKEVASITDRALRLDSFDYPEVFFYNAVANFNLRNVEASEKSVRQALRLDTRHLYPQASYLLGLILTSRREYADAQEQFRTYLKLSPDAPDAAAAKSQLERIEKLTAQGAVPAPKQDQ